MARWVAESNRPLNIVADRELKEILCAGHPEVRVPSRRVLGRDLNTAYEQSRGYIEHLLRVRTVLLWDLLVLTWLLPRNIRGG